MCRTLARPWLWSEIRRSNVDSVELMEVICVRSVGGDGTVESPLEQIVEYWSKHGTLLARTTTADIEKLSPVKSLDRED